jgi:predicted O-linked N-acetylglucosamine transferase (SPINDLY family)
VSYLGFPGTSGSDFIDYIIGDPIVLPLEQQSAYTEQIVQLPDCYQVNDSKRPIAPEAPSRRELGLPESGFVFCCFNNTWKINRRMFDLWMRLLQRVDDSVLWLYDSQGAAKSNLQRAAVDRGIGAARLVFAPNLQLDQHLARLRRADLFLDTLPYNAHTTASDCLWAGVPLVTCMGETFAGRVAASLLNAIGLPDLVTRSLDDYENLSLRLASEAGLLKSLRARIEQNLRTRPLFDTERFKRHIEAAYAKMWDMQQRGEAPRRFSIASIDS